VQNVMISKYADATERTDDMLPAIIEYLARDGKGFVCDPHLEAAINVTLESYLALRRSGMAHPNTAVMSLVVKAKAEREVLLGTNTAAVAAAAAAQAATVVAMAQLEAARHAA
jgi:hypothetical protein